MAEQQTDPGLLADANANAGAETAPRPPPAPVMPRTGVSSGHGKKECPSCHLLVAKSTVSFATTRRGCRSRGAWRASAVYPASSFITTPFLTSDFHAGNLITHMYDTGESTTGWWKRSATSAFTRGDTAYCTPCGPQS